MTVSVPVLVALGAIAEVTAVGAAGADGKVIVTVAAVPVPLLLLRVKVNVYEWPADRPVRVAVVAP